MGMTQNEAEIQEEVLKFYENLYKTKQPNQQAMDKILQLLRNKKVASWKACEGRITEEELKKVIDKSNYNKSPGMDGIPYEYYKKHAHELSPFLVHYYNSIIENQTLGPSMLEGIITLMYKEKGSNTHIKNYRPITLLNCDLKLFTAILALRLARVVHEISDPSNTAAVPGRNITDNTMTLHMIQCYLDGEEMEGYAIMIDWEKCFDLISWEYIHLAIEALGFGPWVRRWVGTLYNNHKPLTRRVLVNGALTRQFYVSRGIPQGGSECTLIQSSHCL